MPDLTCPPSGRGLQVQPQVRQDLLDHRPLEDGRDDLQFTGTAVRAPLRVARPISTFCPARGPKAMRSVMANACSGHSVRASSPSAPGSASQVWPKSSTSTPWRVSIFISRPAGPGAAQHHGPAGGPGQQGRQWPRQAWRGRCGGHSGQGRGGTQGFNGHRASAVQANGCRQYRRLAGRVMPGIYREPSKEKRAPVAGSPMKARCRARRRRTEEN